MLQLGRKGGCLLQKKNTEGSTRNRGGRAEGRLPDQKLNITDEFTDGIISLVICQYKCHVIVIFTNVLYAS